MRISDWSSYVCSSYLDARLPVTASWLVDEERRAAFDGRRGQHFESRYHLTLLYLPPADQVARAERALMERDTPEAGRDWRQELTGFVAETDRVLDLRSEEHTSELQSLMRISYAVFCLKKKKTKI